METKSYKHSNILFYIIFILFLFFTGWWGYLNFTAFGMIESNRQLFSTFYAVMAAFGGVVGLVTAKKWGGFSSYFGQALFFLSLGLLAQVFGQVVYSYYNLVLKVYIPYPSLGDLGYFGSIPCYIYGGLQLARALGAHLSLSSHFNKFLAVAIPAAILTFSYMLLLKGYARGEGEALLGVILNFAYPLSQAIYISIALMTFILSFNRLGGLLRKDVVLLLLAFCVQYLADFTFIYQTVNGSWSIAGIGEYIYFLAYFTMSAALIGLGRVFDSLKHS